VAFVDGYWVTPVDLSEVLKLPPVFDALQSALPPEGRELLNDASRLKQLAALAFTANRLREQVALPYVGDLERTALAAESLGILVAPVKDVEWAVVEYLPPPVALAPESECYYFCGDPEAWDSDRDGSPNTRDDDDDGDGVPDEEDAYPYWPGATACPCGDTEFTGFTEKFSPAVTSAVLAAYELIDGLGDVNRGVVLGRVPGETADVQFVFPAPAAPLENAASSDACPDSSNAATRYVSTDPDACATLRFRCQGSETPFSNECGCGCKRPQ
jgi:hypothetical protein